MERKDLSDAFEIFLKCYPKETIENAYKSFSWRNKNFDQAKDERDQIALNFKKWSDNGFCLKDAFDALNDVYRWGFGRSLHPKLLDTNNIETIIDMLQGVQSGQNMQLALEKSLCIPKLKIATQSKWICMLNQEKFAIYDSRVSMALRDIIIKDKRLFPIVGRRNTRSKKFLYPTYIGNTYEKQACKMAEAYFLYLKLLKYVAEKYNFKSVSKVEMALFMLGDIDKDQM